MIGDDSDLPASATDAVSVLETTRYLRNQLLRDSDVMSMSFGLELRTPLVDRMLLERLWSLPADARLASGKQLLQASVKQLPGWLEGQPKRGFTLPFSDWLGQGLLNDVAPAMDTAHVALEPWYRRWSLAVLGDWQRRHLA